MTTADLDRLRHIHTFPQLIKYLKDELDWPITTDDVDELMFEYKPEELGIDPKNEVKINKIRQLRPLVTNQPWGIFFIEFEPKRLPVVALRRILRGLVIRKRRSTEKPQQATWQLHDLLFISSYGESEQRSLSFAHFSEDPETGDLPVLRVLGWDDRDTLLHLGHAHETLKQKIQWPENEDDLETWRSHWASAFTLRYREVITTSKSLAEHLAKLAKRIRNRANEIMAIESESGPLRKLYEGFMEALIHDLSEDDFADMYAQTIAYGLLTARVSRPAGLVADNLSDMVPITNPFLKELLETFLSAGGRRSLIDFDELGVNDVVELLREANMEAVLRDFGDQAPEEDPVIHFYERFLKEYDPVKRIKRGVFYTPRPVVSFIVRSVDEILRREFGLEDGLADTTTWGKIAEQQSGIEIPEHVSPEMPFVQILDPAVGTGTFLVEAINVIHKTMLEKWRNAGHMELELPKLWNEYVPTFLLPRLFGFELMMAPYAIAHMKVGLKLAETGYRFGTDERAQIYLTNSLEPPHGLSSQVELYAPALAHEAAAVNAVKDQQRFTVVMGNPPYSHMSANLTEELREIVDIYRNVDGSPIQERGAIMFERTLQDDYVKFHALADHLTQGITAIRAYITNNAYLDNPSHRGMRWYLSNNWTDGFFIDLHGDVKRDGPGDENVFDIRTGVAISLVMRTHIDKISIISRFAELIGNRNNKYSMLLSSKISNIEWKRVQPQTPLYLLRPQNVESQGELRDAPSIHDIFILKSEAIKTNRDHFVIGSSDNEILTRISVFIDPDLSTPEVKDRLSINDNAQWSVHYAREECRKTFSKTHLTDIAYRPFDYRRIYYHGSVVFNPRPVLGENVLHRDNLVLLSCRRIRTGKHAHFFLANKIVVKEMLSSADNCNSYPLYRYDQQLGKEVRLPNLEPEFLSFLASRLGIHQMGANGVPDSLTPEDILQYAYAIFYSPRYRNRYAEFLKFDFPRLPLTSNLELFFSLSKLGSELMAYHLLEAQELDDLSTVVIGSGNFQVEKVSYDGQTVWLDKAKTRGFQYVPEEVWNFHIGTYQVCEKWLKDRQAKGGKNPRRGRILTAEDIDHYQKIIVAIHETIRIMKEIDAVIEEHGGWPGAFVKE